jgi:SNF2 family DNA or RNA helicase
MIQHVLTHPRCALWAGMGMGKTSATLFAVRELLAAGRVKKVLVIAPLRVARTTWPDEVGKWNQLQSLRLVPVVGTDKERREALARPAEVYTINYENVQWLVNHLTANAVWDFDMVVLDECTRVKRTRLVQGSKRGASLSTVAFTRVKRWVNLTGTPAPNGLEDLWGQTYFLDQGKRLGRSYSDFENRWFGFQRAKDAVANGRTFVKRIAFPHAQDEIQGLLKDICLTLDPKDWFPIDEPVVTNVYVELPPTARAIYRNMEREMFAEIQGLSLIHI